MTYMKKQPKEAGKISNTMFITRVTSLWRHVCLFMVRDVPFSAVWIIRRQENYPQTYLLVDMHHLLMLKALASRHPYVHKLNEYTLLLVEIGNVGSRVAI